MARYCPEKGGPALYTECQECENRYHKKGCHLLQKIEKFSQSKQIEVYGSCTKCGHPLQPVPYIEKNDHGKIKLAMSYLVCNRCGERYTIDDSYDQKRWYDDTPEIRSKMDELASRYLARMH